LNFRSRVCFKTRVIALIAWVLTVIEFIEAWAHGVRVTRSFAEVCRTKSEVWKVNYVYILCNWV